MTKKIEQAVEFSSRRKRSLNRKRLMDADATVNPDQLPAGTPVVVYSRVSSEEQVQGYSLEAQVNACKLFAGQRKWNIVKFYSDPGHSGKDDNRPGFAEMIADARDRKFKAILVHKLDRFSRNIENTLRYFRDLNSCDVTIASITEDFDYTTAQGRLFFRMMALFAQWYLENLSAEVVKSKVEMARHGIQNGPVPFGYLKDKETGKIVIVEKEASLIRSAFELYATGTYTDQTVADFLNQSGIFTKKGNKWSKDTITDMLQNEFFYGKVAYRDQLWPGRHQPIITKELFDRCLQVRESHRKGPRTHMARQKARRSNLLQQIICCEKCERPLRIQSSRLYGYYIEASQFRGKDCEYSRHRVRMNYADEAAFGLLKSVHLPPDWQSAIQRRVADMDIVRKIEERRLQIDDELRRLGRAFADGAFTEDDYDRRRKKLINEKDSLIVPDGAKVLEMGIQLDNIRDFLEEATDDEKYLLMHFLFDAIYFDFEQKIITRFKPQTTSLKFSEWQPLNQAGSKQKVLCLS